MQVLVHWLWYDAWVGAYFDRKGGVYVCPIPFLVFEIRWKKKQ